MMTYDNYLLHLQLEIQETKIICNMLMILLHALAAIAMFQNVKRKTASEKVNNQDWLVVIGQQSEKYA